MSSQPEAMHLLIEKIRSRALAEGRLMSEQERRLLSEGPESDGPVDDYEPEPHFFDEMAGLLRRSYEEERDVEARRVFVHACSTVSADDSNLGWLVRTAGLNSVTRTRLLPFRRAGLFMLLALPGAGALLAAVGLFWGAAVGSEIAPDLRSTMGVMGIVLGGFGIHLLGVWRKDRQS